MFTEVLSMSETSDFKSSSKDHVHIKWADRSEYTQGNLFQTTDWVTDNTEPEKWGLYDFQRILSA